LTSAPAGAWWSSAGSGLTPSTTSRGERSVLNLKLLRLKPAADAPRAALAALVHLLQLLQLRHLLRVHR
jgi:hypothetical protein